MSKSVRAGRRSLRLKVAESGTPTVDIFFDEHRVWSTALPERRGRSAVRKLRWPRAMPKYLRGTTTLTVRNSATGQELGSREVKFGGPGRVEIIDAQGRWLAINKWNRFGPTLEGDDETGQLLLKDAVKLIEKMQGWGYPVYIVGGTLLGALRNGELLPHDDDIDLCFLTDKSDPQDIILVTFELERRLLEAGYTIVRHSHAHMEVVFFGEDGSGNIDHYIDIFVGYYTRNGLYNQPFALRGELPRSELLPVRQIEVSGVKLPGPAVPEAWCEYAYGPNWLIPDPSFKWTTPPSTIRRFENSFGVFNRQRVFWEKHWQEIDERTPAEPGEFAAADQFLSLIPENSFVVDLGCGDGRQAEYLAAHGHQVLAVDYSLEALRVARQTQTDGVEYRFLNLNNRNMVVKFGLEMIDTGKQPYFFARDLLDVMPPLGRADLFTMLRGVLDDQTFLFATFNTDFVKRLPPNPLTWNLDMKTLNKETWRWKLGVTVLSDRKHKTPQGNRTNATALIWL